MVKISIIHLGMDVLFGFFCGMKKKQRPCPCKEIYLWVGLRNQLHGLSVMCIEQVDCVYIFGLLLGHH